MIINNAVKRSLGIKWLIGFGIFLFIIPIVYRLMHKVPYIILGSSIPICIMVWISIQVNFIFRTPIKSYSQRFDKFAFTKPMNWRQEMNTIRQEANSYQSKQIYPENFIINDTINNIISLIIRDFIESWYNKITSDNIFVVDLRHQFANIIENLHIRLEESDFSNLLVHHIIPILNEHVNAYVFAFDLARNKKIVNRSHNLTEKITDTNDDSIIASNYNKGMLHSSIKLKSKNMKSDTKQYLSKLTSKLLPYLIESKELQSLPVEILLKELVSSCVLFPVFSTLTDPDFYNQMMATQLGKQMKDRDDVKKFRTVLKRHSLDSLNNIPNEEASPVCDSTLGILLQNKLTLTTTPRQFNSLLKLITTTDNRYDLHYYKYYLLLQTRRMPMSSSTTSIEDNRILNNYHERSSIILKTLMNRLSLLDANNTNVNSISSSIPSLSLSNSSNSLPVIYPTPMLPTLSLQDILTTPSRLPYFISYMSHRGDRKILLDFWLSADSLRNPLEYIDMSYKKQTEEKDAGSNKINKEKNEEEDVNDIGVFFDTELSQTSEIKAIYEKYFSSEIMQVPDLLFHYVRQLIESGYKDVFVYDNARRSVLKLQHVVYNRLEKSDFIGFGVSDSWLKMLTNEAMNNEEIEVKKDMNDEYIRNNGFLNNDKSKDDDTPLEPYTEEEDEEINGDPLAGYVENEGEGQYVDVNMSGKVSNKVVIAVEDALSQIMKDRTSEYENSDIFLEESKGSRLVSGDVARDLFGEEEENGLFEDDDDDEDEVDFESYDDSTASSTSKSKEDTTLRKLKIAAPGDLNLTEEIERLEIEIGRLQQQCLIIETLLKKAEIINNVPELRILRKSKAGLEKELRIKELQKEQYIVQEGENSLYGRSKVTIQSYIIAKENFKDFVLYVIQVSKFSPSEPDVVTARWMVTRRFSQFYEMHHYLKTKYSDVGNIPFPKKKVVMKFQQNSLIEERKTKLKEYLQELIEIKTVCSDQVFRDFLSSEVFGITLDSTLQNAKSEIKKGTISATTKLYNRVSNQMIYPLISFNSSDKIITNLDGKRKLPDKNFSEMEREVSSVDEYENDKEKECEKLKDVSFVKPICDLVVSIFQLNKTNGWLRGRAMVLVFQQLLGSTVEKVIRTNIDGKLKQEDTVSVILTGLQDLLWPNGEFKRSKEPRTMIEKLRSKKHAKLLLNEFIVDTCSKIFGKKSSEEAADIIYNMLQNEILNRNLALSILDEVVYVLFPEIRDH